MKDVGIVGEQQQKILSEYEYYKNARTYDVKDNSNPTYKKNRSLTMHDWLEYFGYPIKHRMNHTSKVVWIFN